MAKHHDFLFNIAKLCGDKDYKRHDRRNVLIYHDEIKGDSPFSRTPEDREDRFSRLSIYFEGLPENGVSGYCMRLARLIELYHYKHAHKITNDEAYELAELEVDLAEEEKLYPEVAEVLAVSEVSASVASTASGDKW